MDLAEIDENGKGLQFFGKTKVERLEKIEGQPNVYLLQTTIELERPNQAVPKPGQFYLIRSAKSAVHYNRPISVYHSEEWISNEGIKRSTIPHIARSRKFKNLNSGALHKSKEDKTACKKSRQIKPHPIIWLRTKVEVEGNSMQP